MKELSSIFFLVIVLSISSFVAKCSNCEISDSKTNILLSKSDFVIRVDNSVEHPVSNKLMGFNLIYPHEKNSIWQDGRIAGYLKDVNVAFLRYPGGTVCSYYHWNKLTGEGWKDSWDPVNPVQSKASSEFMDLDEYMSIVKSTGATPLLGINVSSGWRWNRKQDGINEALALMKYCKNKNFKVQYWYLDNEPYQHDSNGGTKTPEQYADLINTYAPVMKAFDPNIKVVANWNSGFKTKRAEYERLIKAAGANIDIIDAHWYWNWNDPSWQKWLQKTPMGQWTGESYEEDIAYFRKMVTDLGYPDIKLASFEWNSGPPKGGNFTTCRSALTQAEMMMQFISGGLDYAVFWPIHWPDKATKIRSFVDPVTKKANPNYYLFKFLGKMQGGILIQSQIIRKGENIIAISVQDSDLKALRICILNKNEKDQISEVRLDKFPGMKLKESTVYQVSNDGSNYTFTKAETVKPENSQSMKIMSKSISLTMLTFTKN
jgi:alpha-L-arabinofuranosidase